MLLTSVATLLTGVLLASAQVMLSASTEQINVQYANSTSNPTERYVRASTPSAPTNIVRISATYIRLTVGWQHGGDVDWFAVRALSAPYDSVQHVNATADNRTAELTGLWSGIKYNVTVTAWLGNSYAESDHATMRTLPPEPSSVNCSSPSNGSLLVTIVPSTRSYYELDTYVINYGVSTCNSNSQQVNVSAGFGRTVDVVLSGLKTATQYQICVYSAMAGELSGGNVSTTGTTASAVTTDFAESTSLSSIAESATSSIEQPPSTQPQTSTSRSTEADSSQMTTATSPNATTSSTHPLSTTVGKTASTSLFETTVVAMSSGNGTSSFEQPSPTQPQTSRSTAADSSQVTDVTTATSPNTAKSSMHPFSTTVDLTPSTAVFETTLFASPSESSTSSVVQPPTTQPQTSASRSTGADCSQMTGVATSTSPTQSTTYSNSADSAAKTELLTATWTAASADMTAMSTTGRLSTSAEAMTSDVANNSPEQTSLASSSSTRNVFSSDSSMSTTGRLSNSVEATTDVANSSPEQTSSASSSSTRNPFTSDDVTTLTFHSAVLSSESELAETSTKSSSSTFTLERYDHSTSSIESRTLRSSSSLLVENSTSVSTSSTSSTASYAWIAAPVVGGVVVIVCVAVAWHAVLVKMRTVTYRFQCKESDMEMNSAAKYSSRPSKYYPA